MKIGIFQDVHANLPAFKKAIQLFEAHGCDLIFHVGDLIGIGPHPKEVFELATQMDKLILIMGNHDYWFAHGLPDPIPGYMSKEEVEHQKWNHTQIGVEKREIVQQWKFIEEYKISEARKISFLHYGFDAKNNWFKTYIPIPNPENLDALFQEIEAEWIFYGHHHVPSDIQGNARYVNLGSAGCNTKAEVRIGILSILGDGTIELQKITAPYEDNGLMQDFEKRKVPAREFITKHFIVRSV